ncbi:MAG: hypothetical protein WBG50_25070 [Desulfomonilaceae bacterium]
MHAGRSVCTLPKSVVAPGLSSGTIPGNVPKRQIDGEDKKEQIVAFRFGVIHDLLGEVKLESGNQEHLIREKCNRKWVIPVAVGEQSGLRSRNLEASCAEKISLIATD